MALFKQKGDPKLSGVIDLNAVLLKIGHWGKFHWIQLCLLWIVCMSSGIGIVSFAFTGFLPKYRCLIPQCEDIETATYYQKNITYLDENLKMSDFEFSDYVGLAIGDLKHQDKKYSCERMTFDDDQDTCDNFKAKLRSKTDVVGNTKTVNCSPEELVFDKTYVESSFSTYYGFTCSRFYLKGIFNSLVMVGMLVGSVSVGVVSDYMGRKRTLQILNLLFVVAGVINAFKPPIIIFAICRILIGMCSIGTYICAYVCLIEGTLTRMTVIVSRALATAWTLGEFVMVGIAFQIRVEDLLQHSLYWPILILQIPLFFVMESTRWLIAHGRIEEAKNQIAKIAEINGKVAPAADAGSAEISSDIGKGVEEKPDGKIQEEQKADSVRYWDLFRPSKIIIRTLILFLQWFSVTALFYSLTFGSLSLAGDPYTNFAVGLFFQLPAVIVSLYVLDRLGRRFTEVTFMTTGGILVLASGLLIESDNSSAQSATIAMFSLARLCASVCFSAVYLFAVEMYPTKIRGSALGTCSTVGRIGGVFGLSIDGLKTIWYPLPIVIIGCVAILAGILSFFLPETTGEKLPENNEQALKIGNNPKKVPWCSFSLAPKH